MPQRGVDHRSRQLAHIAGLLHERESEPIVGELLAVLEQHDRGGADGPVAVNVRELRRDYDRAVRVPRSLVEELARTTAVAHQEWVLARRANDFARFQPWLERIVALKRDQARCLGFEGEAYDALLDVYEPGSTTARVQELFDALRPMLVTLLDRIRGAPKPPDRAVLHREYPLDVQRAFGLSVAERIGFDLNAGRVDISAHPFCTGIGPGDCRITTRYRVDDVSEAFFGILHEVGHGLYEQGLETEHAGTPMGEAASLGVHESQSRMWENIVGRSRAFWTYAYPLAQAAFPAALSDVSVDDFYGAVNRVAPTVNRVRADEVTYNLHILVRFELERALLSGDLRAADVPGAWNDAYERYLGIRPESDADGCLQDSHWSGGLFGYFPTYTIGDATASQLFDQARRDLGDLDGAFAAGEFAPLLGWLRANVHRHGRRDSAEPLVRRLTGRSLSPSALIDRLTAKYQSLYGW